MIIYNPLWILEQYISIGVYTGNPYVHFLSYKGSSYNTMAPTITIKGY